MSGRQCLVKNATSPKSIVILSAMIICIILIVFAIQAWVVSSHHLLTNQISSHLDEYKNTESLITSRGYPFESHNVTTDDGYILQIHRIPYSPFRKHKAKVTYPPVYFQHGLFGSSGDWVIIGRHQSLVFLLSDMGYDVWLGNARGNRYSKNHVRLSPNDPQFWNFSWDEMGRYDLPANIDLIRKVSGSHQLFYVGHSMGTTMYFAMANSRSNYQQYIRLMTALAPVAYVGHIKSPFVKYLAPFSTTLEDILEYLGNGDFSIDYQPFKFLIKIFCDLNKIEEIICSNILFLFAGYDRREFDPDLLPTILDNTPAGTSVYTVAHYTQMYKSKRFCYFDFGPSENMKAYNATVPPNYNLMNLETNISLHYSLNDWLAVPTDVNRVIQELGASVVYKRLVPLKDFDHLDFLWAKDVKTLLYDKVIRIIKNFTLERN